MQANTCMSSCASACVSRACLTLHLCGHQKGAGSACMGPTLRRVLPTSCETRRPRSSHYRLLRLSEPPQGRGSHPAQPGSAWWHWRTGTSVVLAALAKPCRPPPANGRSLPSTFLHPANYTVTTILPNCTLDSRYRCASTIRSNGNVLAMIGRSAPAASPSAMYALAAASRVGSSMISWTR